MDFLYKAKNHDFSSKPLGEYLENKQMLVLEKTDYSIQCHLTMFYAVVLDLYIVVLEVRFEGKDPCTLIGLLELFRKTKKKKGSRSLNVCHIKITEPH